MILKYLSSIARETNIRLLVKEDRKYVCLCKRDNDVQTFPSYPLKGELALAIL